MTCHVASLHIIGDDSQIGIQKPRLASTALLTCVLVEVQIY